MARRRLSEEERLLWETIAKTAKPLKPKAKAKPAVQAPVQTAAAKPAPPGKMQKRAKAPPSPPPTPIPAPLRPAHELSHGLSTGIDKRQAERFRRGQTPIDGKIDLHGRTQQEAHDALHTFIMRAHRAGKRCLLVITGKGMTTGGMTTKQGVAKAGVLKENVPRWLNEPSLRRHVLAFAYARPEHGGEGALYVLLKREREVPK
jgi:DNA-nicking Smr family endonuclease